MAENIDDRVRQIIAEHLGVAIEKVEPDAELIDDLGADSLDLVELGIAFEDELSLSGTIPDETLDRWRTVGDMLKTVAELA